MQSIFVVGPGDDAGGRSFFREYFRPAPERGGQITWSNRYPALY